MMMNSKINRPIKAKKPINAGKSEDQVLKAESSKIQNKLETLKAEIAMRKTIKNKQKQSQQLQSLKLTNRNNTGESWTTSERMQKSGNQMQKIKSINKVDEFLTTKTKSNYDANESDKKQLSGLLQSLRMQQFLDTIVGTYHVKGFSKLLQLNQQDIDQWKSIPIGFRVKLKKILAQHNRQNQNVLEEEKQDKIIIPENQQQQKMIPKRLEQEDIEMIIKRRKNQKRFEPLNKQIQYQQQQQAEYVDRRGQYGTYEEIESNNNTKIENSRNKSDYSDKDEEDILISSLNQAFLQRRGIIKKEGSKSSIEGSPNCKSQNKGKVHWDKNVVEYNKQTSNFVGQRLNTKYPKIQLNTEKSLMQGQRAQYCWSCLKKLNIQWSNTTNQVGKKTYCSNKCREDYQMMIKKKALMAKYDVEIEEGGNFQRKQKSQQQEQEVDLNLM